MFEKANKIILKTLNKKGLDKVVSSARVCYEADKIFTAVLPKLKNKISIESFDRGVLKVSSVNAAVNQEIQFKKIDLLKKINRRLQNEEIRNLRFSIKS